MNRNVLSKGLVYSIVLWSSIVTVSGQVSQKIGGNPGTIDPKAVLELESTTKGFLLPRMTAVQVAAITNPTSGMIVFCTDCGVGSDGELRISYNGVWQTYKGNVTGNITGNAATVTTNANLTGPITSSGNATSVASQTGTGSTFVMNTSPTLVTPVLGAATATSINNTPIPDSKTLVVTTDKLNVMSSTSSTELAGVISDETGTGSVVLSNSPTFTGTVTAPIYASTPQPLTDAATISWNPTNGLNASVTLGGNRTLSFTSPPSIGSYGTLVVTQDATGNRTITLPSSLTNKVLGLASTATTIDLSTAANSKDILNFYYDGTYCYWNVGQGYGTEEPPLITNLATNVSGTLAVANGGTGSTTLTGYVKGNGTSAMTANAAIPVADVTGAAPLASPTFTGTPTLPTGTIGVTQTAGNNTTALATTAFVTAANTTNANLTGMVTSVGNATTVVTNANLTGAVTSTGNATSLGSFTSADLATALSNETGTGVAVLATSPTLVTPVLGAATATTINSTAIPTSKILVVTTDKLNVMAATSSSELAGVISDETGTGSVVLSNSPTFTGSVTSPIYASTPQALSDAATISWNPTNGLNASVTLGGNRTLSFASTPTVGSYGTLIVTQDATGNRTITLPSSLTNKVLGSASTATTIALSTAAGATDILNFYYDGSYCYWNIGQGYGTAAAPVITNLATNVSGTLAVANGGTGATTLTGLVKGNGTGAMTAAVAGTDYVAPSGNITGNAATVTTNANLTGAVTSTGNATSLGSFTSANLASALSDETGSGVAVLATSPTLVTPVLGAATGTSLSVTGQLTSTVATGTAPLVVTSTTPVTNLSIGGNAATATATGITDDATTSTAVYPTFVTANTGNLPQKVTSTKLSFVPSTGALSATSFVGSGAALTGVVATTNANLTGAVTSTGNATSLGSFTSANLASALSDETGTGVTVLATSPTLVTPVLGAATGTSLSVTGQLTSTVATGTAPLVVTSTTPVANLNIGGNAATVTTNANLTGVVTSTGNATAIADAALSIAKTSGLQTAIDGKVADAINDATTTIAPSQNAVFDALALKANLASPTFTGTVTAPIYASTPQALTYGSTINWTPTSGLNASVTLTGNGTLSFTTPPSVGSYGTLIVTQDPTGNRTITLPGTANKVLGSASTTTIALSTAANAKDILNFYFDGFYYYWNVGQGYGTAAPAVITNLATNVSGTLAVANGGTGAATLTGLVKGNGTGAMTAAVAGTDYVAPSGNITGNAATVTTNANLTGVVTSSGNATAIAAGVITNTMLANGAVANLSGTNTGDNAVNSLYSGLVSNATHTGDVAGSTTLTLATVNSNIGTFGSATSVPTFTVNAKGLVTAASATAIPTATSTTAGLLTSTDWNTFNNKQGAISLTTTGSSGASSFTSNTLNIPTYTLSGLGGQPLATNLTSIGGLANASGVLVNNGSGTFSYSTTPTLTGTNFSGVPYSALTGTVPTWNQSTTGTAANVTGVVAISNGGTGSATQNFVDLTTVQTVAGNKTFSNTITANTIVKTGGTSAQFLMADGSVSSGTPLLTEADIEETASAGQTSFALTQTPSSLSKVKMYINGIRISKNAYTISGSTLTYIPANNENYTITAGDRVQFEFAY